LDEKSLPLQLEVYDFNIEQNAGTFYLRLRIPTLLADPNFKYTTFK